MPVTNKREVDVIEDDDEYVIVRIKKRRGESANDAAGRAASLPEARAVVPPSTPPIDHTSWIAPSRLRNYMHGDPLLDWLDMRGGASFSPEHIGLRDNSADGDSGFINFIMQKGIEFESRVIAIIRQRFPGMVHQVSYGPSDVVSPDRARATDSLIEKGVPFIYQGVLHDADTRSYGCPDLLVRNDYLTRLVPGAVLARRVKQRWSRFAPPHFYYIVDIKFTTLPLRANSVGLLNSGSVPYYKTQLTFYNDILTKKQHYRAPYGYLLGRGYTYRKCGDDYTGNSCFAKLGVVDFLQSDKDYADRTANAVAWVKRVRANAHRWQVLPKPSVPELYPNMANARDYPHHATKEYIARELREITLLWGCGLKQRRNAHLYKIYRYDDSRLNTKRLGLNGPIQSRIVQTMIEFNRDSASSIRPDVVTNNVGEWQARDRLEFYVDFETVPNIFDDFTRLPYRGGVSMIFMIGVGYTAPGSSTWMYRTFTAKRLSKSDECDMLEQFLQYMTAVVDHYDVEYTPNVYHWSRAEPIQFTKALSEHVDVTVCVDFNFVDLLTVFKDDTILVRGVFDFGLKSVARGLASLGFIPDLYTGAVSGGSDAMLRAATCYKTAATRDVSVTTLIQFRQIVTYNEVDCKVMWYIVDYLRKNHTTT